MTESKSNNTQKQSGIQSTEDEPKWDYTTNEQTLFIGALVVGLNLLVIIALVLDRTVPIVHSFFSGKPV